MITQSKAFVKSFLKNFFNFLYFFIGTIIGSTPPYRHAHRNDGEDFLSNPSVDYVATFLYKDGFMTSGAIMTGFVLANPSGAPIKIPLLYIIRNGI